MPRGRILTPEERLAIVREAAKGVAIKGLAQRFGVTPRTIHYTIRRDKERKRDTGIRTAAASVTVTPEEMAAFDAVLRKHGMASRADGLRALMQSASGVFVPDGHLSGELGSFRASLNRVGNNVSQIARRMNEARKRGVPPMWTDRQHAEVRALAGLILEMSDEIDLLVRRRAKAMDLTVNDVLREFAHGAE